MKNNYYKNRLLKLFALKDKAEQENNDAILIETYGKIARIYEKLEDHEDAIEWLLKKIPLLEKHDDVKKLYKTHYKLSLLYLQAKLYYKCIEHSLSAEKVAQNKKQKLTAILHRANAHNWSYEFDIAEQLLNESFKYASKRGFYSVLPQIYLGQLKNNHQKYSEAEKYFKQALNQIPANNFEKKCDVITSLAFSFYGRGNDKKAIEILKQAENLFSKFNNNYTKLKVYQYTYLSYYELKDFENAFSYYKKYVATEKLIKDDKIKHKLASIEVNNQLIQVQSERKALQDKNLILAEKNEIIDQERKKSDSLLLNILPETIAHELKHKGRVEAKFYNSVSVLFTDFSGFTSIAEKLTPQILVSEIDDCFRVFDEIALQHGLEKIKTIGDAYMAACGLPIPCKNHAIKIVQAAIEMRNYMLLRKSKNKVDLKMRVGIHSGSVVAGVVGIKKFAYDIWGDAVNIASRMESSGEIGKVNISQSTYLLVKDEFNCKYRGKILAKGKGEVEMYFVEAK